MAEDKPEDKDPLDPLGPSESSPDPARARREPPTIDLEATEISSDTGTAEAAPEPEPAITPPSPSRLSAAIIAAASGAMAAALVLAVATLAGWPQPVAPPSPQVNSAALDDLAARIAGVEARISKPAVAGPDPATAARAESLEKLLTALRSEFAAQRAQSEKLAADVNDVKSAPREAAPPPDLSAINERIAQIERASRAQSAAIAQESSKPADDVPLRRIVAATLLDVVVRVGEPYPAALTVAKSLSATPDALKPLEGFAASGVPGAASLSRELLTLVPKLSPPPPENSTTGAGIVDRLQAGAAKLVRIERTDVSGSDRGAVVARVTAAALRNDLAEARRELKTLAPADRAAAQAWLDKADARDAALAASRQFAADAMAALAKPRQ